MTTKQIIAFGMASVTVLLAILFQNWLIALWALLVVIITFWAFNGSSVQKIKPTSISNKKEKEFSAEDIANVLPDAFLLIKTSGNIAFINDAGQSIFPDLKIGTKFLSRFRDPAIVNLFDNARHSHEAKTMTYLEKGVQERFFSIFIQPFENMIVCIFRDMSESRKLDKMRADFIANASHELRTPLASLRGFIETLNGAAKNDAAARDNFLPIMQEQSERMSRLIDDLLSLSRLEMKTTPTKLENVDLAPLVRHVCETLSPLTHELDIEIRLSIESLSPVQGDYDELIQLFQNLIENACKYGSHGEFVDINGSQENGHVIITIRDYGIGIASEHIPRLTERFYRVNAKMSHAHKGTGLGLAIVKHILVHHNGRLAIQSTVGEGSSFQVIMPLEKLS